MQSAAKVGFLLVVFVVLLFGGYAVLGHSVFAQPKLQYLADMEDAAGTTEGTPVLMAGVTVGTVSKVALLGPKVARMTLELKHDTKVPAGTEVVISPSLTGLGQSPVNLVPPEIPTGALASTAVPLKGHKANPLDSFLPNSKETVGELTRTITAVRKLLEDQKLRGRIDSLMASTNVTIDKFGKLAGTFDSTLAANQAHINEAISAATKAVVNVQQMTSTFSKYLAEGKLQKNAETILTRMQTIEKHTDDLVLNLSKLVNDPKLREPAGKIAQNVADITNTGKKIAANADEMTKNGAEISKNGIEISKNVAVISQKAIGLTDKANEIASNAVDIEHQLKGVLDKVGGFFGHAPSAPNFKLGSEIDLMRQNDPGHWRTDITFNTPLPDGVLYAGIYDAFETNKLTIQVGKPVGLSAMFRYGIYASKPGFGVDYSLAKRISLRADAWDINNPQLAVRARYDFGGGFAGWLGVDSVFHNNTPTIGFGLIR